jgi:hypothetical protein
LWVELAGFPSATIQPNINIKEMINAKYPMTHKQKAMKTRTALWCEKIVFMLQIDA